MVMLVAVSMSVGCKRTEKAGYFGDLRKDKTEECALLLSQASKQIGQYMASHNSKYPPTLVDAGFSGTCPVTGKAYVYAAPQDIPSDMSTIIACEAGNGHSRGHLYMKADTSIAIVTEEQFKNELAKPVNAAIAAAFKAAQ